MAENDKSKPAANVRTSQEKVVRTTVELSNVPAGTVELLSKTGFKISLEKLKASDLLDQTELMRLPIGSDGQGCIGNPDGPGC